MVGQALGVVERTADPADGRATVDYLEESRTPA
jgi:hypothetical protein